jgi:hypothetical protein
LIREIRLLLLAAALLQGCSEGPTDSDRASAKQPAEIAARDGDGSGPSPQGLAWDSPLIEDSEAAACDVVKMTIAELRLSTKKPDPEWYCDFAEEDNEYLRIVALRSHGSEKAGAYSNLIGWFAVARQSQVVLEWDLGNDRLVALTGSK